MVLALILQMLQRLLGLLEDIRPPVAQLEAEIVQLAFFMKGSLSDGR
jgi:hypothetical protein